MADATKISEAEAIRQVIADGFASDFVDVVNEVQKRFRLQVTSSQVEQVYNDLVSKKKPPRLDARVEMQMTSKPPGEPQPEQLQPSKTSTDEVSHALQFVKSVGGIARAKRALAELETILLGS